MGTGMYYTRVFITLIIILGFNIISDCQIAGNSNNGKDSAQIIFIVDVSYSQSQNSSINRNFVSTVYTHFHQSDMRNKFYLITFSTYAKLYKNIYSQKNIDSLLNLEYQRTKRNVFWDSSTYPKEGFQEVSDIISAGFPKNGGLIFFISDGENSIRGSGYDLDSLDNTIKFLLNNGYYIFTIFSPAKNKLKVYNCEKCMSNIASVSGLSLFKLNNDHDINNFIRSLEDDRIKNIQFNSPITYSEYMNLNNKFNKQIEDLNIKFYISIIFLGIILIAIIGFVINYFFRLKKLHFRTLWGKLSFIDDEKASSLNELSINSPVGILDLPFKLKSYKNLY
jgi:hypothetical protein